MSHISRVKVYVRLAYAKAKVQISCAVNAVNCTADQHLSFGYTDSIITFPGKSKILSFLPFNVNVQAGMCQTWL